MKTSFAALAAILFASVVPACYDPSLKECVIACGPEGSCASGQRCSAGFCTSHLECSPDDGAADSIEVRPETVDHPDATGDGDSEVSPDADANADSAVDADAERGDADSAVGLADGVAGTDGGADANDGSLDMLGNQSDVRETPDAGIEGGSIDSPVVAAPVCPPGIRVNPRTGRCALSHDLNGDGMADGIASSLYQTDALISDGTQFHLVAQWIDGGPYASIVGNVQGILAGDVNGDRITDFVAFAPNHVAVLIGTGIAGALESDVYTHFYDGDTTSIHGTLFTYLADLTGDGKDDLIAINPNEIDVGVSTGTRFREQEKWAAGTVVGNNGLYFADVDGDYCADAITVGDTNVVVRLSTKLKFGAATPWLSATVEAGDVVHFADADGDGRADYIRVRAASTFVALSQGNGFAAEQAWSTEQLAGSSKTFFADVDGDGRADVIAVNADSVKVALSKGNAFAEPTVWYSGRFIGETSTNFAFEPAGRHPQP
jgi:hypothetical protein